MLLNELFTGRPVLVESATVQLVVNHIRDLVPNVRAIWLQRASKGAPWNFTAVVHDQTHHEELLAAVENVKRIEQGMKGVNIQVRVIIESAFEQSEGAMKVYAAPPLVQ